MTTNYILRFISSTFGGEIKGGKCLFNGYQLGYKGHRLFYLSSKDNGYNDIIIPDYLDNTSAIIHYLTNEIKELG